MKKLIFLAILGAVAFWAYKRFRKPTKLEQIAQEQANLSRYHSQRNNQAEAARPAVGTVGTKPGYGASLVPTINYRFLDPLFDWSFMPMTNGEKSSVRLN